MSSEIIAALFGFVFGLALTLIVDKIRKDAQKNVMREALRVELLDIKHLQKESTWVPLSTLFWNDIKKSTILTELCSEERKTLFTLYAKINNKNNLLLYQKIELERTKDVREPFSLGITNGEGKNPRLVRDIIGDLTETINSLIDKVLDAKYLAPREKDQSRSNNALKDEQMSKEDKISQASTISRIVLIALISLIPTIILVNSVNTQPDVSTLITIEDAKFIAGINRDFIIFWAILFFTCVVGIIELLGHIDDFIKNRTHETLIAILYFSLVAGIICSVFQAWNIYRINYALAYQTKLGLNIENFVRANPSAIDWFETNIQLLSNAWWELLILLLILTLFGSIYGVKSKRL